MLRLLSFLVLFAMSGANTDVAASGSCDAISVGLDTTLANGYGGSNIGKSVGQSFFAPTPHLASITVWRAAVEFNFTIGMDLHIFETDSLETPQMDREVLDGPTIVHSDGDGVHDTEFRWTFDPPVELPAVGTYAFFLRQDPCLGYFDVIARGGDPMAYPDGHAWESQRGVNCALVPFAAPSSYPDADLIFKAEFCVDAVPVRHSTWGRVKTIYR